MCVGVSMELVSMNVYECVCVSISVYVCECESVWGLGTDLQSLGSSHTLDQNQALSGLMVQA